MSIQERLQKIKSKWKNIVFHQKISILTLLLLMLVLPLAIGAVLTRQYIGSRANEPITPPTITTPSATSQPSHIYENDFIRIWESRVFPGIIDLFYKTQSGNWEQYNNIVPIAKVGGIWANAEIDKSTITTEVVEDNSSQKIIKYQFDKLSNGAHFYLLMTLNNAPEVVFQVVLNPDSNPIEAMSLGNYYGYSHLIQNIKVNSTTYNAADYKKPSPDGNYLMGRFINLELPSDGTITFWSENQIVQKQTVSIPLTDSDEVVAEIRYTPWLPSQPQVNKNWFETVHITRSPFTESKSIWKFSFDLPVVSTPKLTATPSPVPTPVEVINQAITPKLPTAKIVYPPYKRTLPKLSQPVCKFKLFKRCLIWAL